MRGTSGLLEKLVDWLNREGTPDFSLDPEWKPKPGTRPMPPGGESTGAAPHRRAKPFTRKMPWFRRPREAVAPVAERAPNDQFSSSIEVNVDRMRRAFSLPRTSDVVLREFEIPVRRGLRAAIVFVSSMVDSRMVNADLLRPLLTMSRDRAARVERALARGEVEKLFPAAVVYREDSLPNAVWKVLGGGVAVLVDGVPAAIVADASDYPYRNVDQPVTERIVRGPQQAFVEAIRVNTSLVRRILRTPNLVCDSLRVGAVSGTQVSLLYISGLANPRLVQEVKRRLRSIKVDYVATDGDIEQYIGEARFGYFVPSVFITERPDRFCAHLAEGYVGVLVDHSPMGMVIPCTAATLFQNPEDFYVEWPYGTFLRLIRLAGILLSVLAPAVYVAAINYHQEMVPSNLLFSIAAPREAVPLPAALNIALSLMAFDLIQEAGIRVPSPMGPTIGIVGALLIGEAAVRASLLTPDNVILVAVTAVSSYTVASPQLALILRLSKYVFLLAASLFGFLGVAISLFAHLVFVCSIRNFGVPFMTPFAPRTKGSPDVITRGPLWEMEKMPPALRTLRQVAQPRVSRGWMDVRGRRMARGGRKQGEGRDARGG